MIQPSVIIDRVFSTLIETGPGTYWTRAELLDWLNQGAATLVQVKPDANPQTVTMNLVAGARQTLPDDAVLLLDVLNNGTGGAVHRVRIEDLRDADPDWQAADQTAQPGEYSYDPRDETHFTVNPPNDATGKLTLVVSQVPAVITDEDTPLPLPTEYQAALYAYVLAMAYAKNTVRGDLQKTSSWMGTFYQLIGADTQGEATDTAGAGNGKP